MSEIRIYDKIEPEYLKLSVFADIVNNLLNDTSFHMNVEETYFDFGQDWKYSALITHDYMKNDSWQSVCPRDYKLILNCNDLNHMINMAKFYAEEIQKNQYSINLSNIA